MGTAGFKNKGQLTFELSIAQDASPIDTWQNSYFTSAFTNSQPLLALGVATNMSHYRP
jgi:hypothetical protein